MAVDLDINFPMHDKRFRHNLPNEYCPGGHRGRYSDSSSYDDLCVMCGSVDSETGYYQQRCHRAVSDEVAQAARDAHPNRVAVEPGNVWIKDAPGQGQGGLAAGTLLDKTNPEPYRTREVGGLTEFYPVDIEAEAAALVVESIPPLDPEARLAELSAAASSGRIAVPPFLSVSGDEEIADLIIKDPSFAPFGFRILARGLLVQDARYIARLWNADRSKRS